MKEKIFCRCYVSAREIVMTSTDILPTLQEDIKGLHYIDHAILLLKVCHSFIMPRTILYQKNWVQLLGSIK